jgi:chromosome segregation ATPase
MTHNMAKIETVAALESVIARLEKQRADLEQRGKTLADVRASLAYSALADGNDQARAKLDKLNLEAATHSSEIAAVQAAIKTAGQRLANARDHEAKAADRDQAKELRVVLDQFVQTATHLDQALADVATLGHNLHQIQARMRELGSPVPNAAQLDSLGYRCLLTACASTPWFRHFETLAPSERRSFSALIDIWRATNEKHLAVRLGGEQTNKPEAA